MEACAFRRFATSALAVAAWSLVLPAAGEAKVSCEGDVRASNLALVGLPANPQAGRIYSVTVDLPRSDAANPRALLIGVRCGRDPDAVRDHTCVGPTPFSSAARRSIRPGMLSRCVSRALVGGA